MKAGDKITLCRRLPGFVKYKDQYGIEHQAIGYVDKTDITITKNKVTRRPGYVIVHREGCTTQGEQFVQDYDTWGDGIDAEHYWTRKSTGDIYRRLTSEWAGLAVIAQKDGE